MVAAILLYFGLIFGIRFTSTMEAAWALALIVALVQEFFIHQLIIAAVRAAAIVLLQPLRADNYDQHNDTPMTRSLASSKTYETIASFKNLERLRKVKLLSKPPSDKDS